MTPHQITEAQRLADELSSDVAVLIREGLPQEALRAERAYQMLRAIAGQAAQERPASGLFPQVTAWQNIQFGPGHRVPPTPAPAVDVEALMALADSYARAAATARVEGLYGTSKSYTRECIGQENKARTDLNNALRAALEGLKA